MANSRHPRLRIAGRLETLNPRQDRPERRVGFELRERPADTHVHAGAPTNLGADPPVNLGVPDVFGPLDGRGAGEPRARSAVDTALRKSGVPTTAPNTCEGSQASLARCAPDAQRVLVALALIPTHRIVERARFPTRCSIAHTCGGFSL